MTAEETAAAIHERIWTSDDSGNFPVVVFCGVKTYRRLLAILDAADGSFLLGLGCVPEGAAYVMTEGALRERLETWPAGDVVRMGDGG